MMEAHTLTEQEAACIFHYPSLTATQFEIMRQRMPSLLQHDGIVFTEQLFNIKPLEIPLEAVKFVVNGAPPKQKRSVFMKMLQNVVANPESCMIVSGDQDKQFAFPKEVFSQVLYGVAVCIQSYLNYITINVIS